MGIKWEELKAQLILKLGGCAGNKFVKAFFERIYIFSKFNIIYVYFV